MPTTCSNCGQKISFMGRVCPWCNVDKSRDKAIAVWAGGAVLALAFGFAVGIAVGISMRAVSLHSSRERVSFAARIKSVGESRKTRGTIDSTEPPLVRAIWAGDRDSLARLIARGADVNVRDKSGNDPALLLAVEHGLPFVQLLVQAGGDVKQTNSAGIAALHQAAYVGDPAVADYLLKKGANINAKTAEGDTPLSVAATFGSVPMCLLLMSRGGDVNQKNNLGETPLYNAALNGHSNLVEVFASRGANVNVADSYSRQTALIGAASKNHVNTVRLLLQSGANPVLADRAGKTALTRAREKGYFDVLQVIRDYEGTYGMNEEGAVSGPYNLTLTSNFTTSPQTVGEDTPIPADIQRFLLRWQKATVMREPLKVADCYTPVVDIYFRQVKVSRDQVALTNDTLFKRYTRVVKYQLSDIRAESVTENTARITFRKSWDMRGDHRFLGRELERLVLRKTGGTWNIASEQELKIFQAAHL